ncbi:MAG: cytochrome P450 [Actinobacteria bacterium]|nr:cytochrome P450 [Actinomycetota bacterium]
MTNWAEFNLNDPKFVANPYPVMAQLRLAGAPIWHEVMQMWLAPRHADASAVLRAKTLGRIFNPREPADIWETFNWLHADSILDSEPPKHTRLRSLVAKAFNRGQIDRLAPRINELVAQLISDCQQKLNETGSFDVIADYAEPLPVMVIAELLGVPVAEQDQLRPWSQAIVKMYEYGNTQDQQAAARAASSEFAALVTEMVEFRKKQPTTDLVTELALVEEAGEKLTLKELIATCVLLLNAGHEASVNGFGNGFVAAMQHPDAVAKLRSNPREIAATAVEEFLRFDSPLQLFERTATAETNIGGITVEVGQKIAALLGSANRDESVFRNATVMDLTRDPNPQIGFGGGIHFCLGAPLARLEMATSLPALFEAFPKLELAGNPVMRPTFVLRGYESIAVTA